MGSEPGIFHLISGVPGPRIQTGTAMSFLGFAKIVPKSRLPGIWEYVGESRTLVGWLSFIVNDGIFLPSCCAGRDRQCRLALFQPMADVPAARPCGRFRDSPGEERNSKSFFYNNFRRQSPPIGPQGGAGAAKLMGVDLRKSTRGISCDSASGLTLDPSPRTTETSPSYSCGHQQWSQAAPPTAVFAVLGTMKRECGAKFAG